MRRRGKKKYSQNEDKNKIDSEKNVFIPLPWVKVKRKSIHVIFVNNNKKIKKWEDLEFLQRRHTDGEQTYEKVLT